MKKIVVSLFALMVLTAVVFSAPLGLGVKVGEPTGLYIRSYTSSTSFAGITAAWSFTNDNFTIQADFNGVSPNLFGDIDFSYGGGIHLGVKDDDLNLGIRFPLALNYAIPETPLITFLEIAPGFSFAPETNFDLSGGLGLVYSF
ncbi:hypothetical protein X927_03175 [Petrotoga mexicana DSM 14811]|uniref:Outer membrane protein beta-barrel domain-containing protein n=1 Tax=Petrotoga mexicana DSM 14811 TaxID=1122954 RepID=A0A2K1PCJ1_9BACT|nr:hypothetical protein [Petrotoga mexicana]PNS00499.1 hypothetical protein X927_03175 [Petrotoga mexicana DSM 14811]